MNTVIPSEVEESRYFNSNSARSRDSASLRSG